MKRLLISLGLLMLPACTLLQQGAPEVADTGRGWRAVATPADRERLRDWREAFAEALAAARRSGHADAIAREGALLDPDAAMPGAPLPNGEYRCRVIKIGAKAEGLLDYVAYPYFACRIAPDGGIQRLTKLTGSQRHVGLIFPGDALRHVFLGTLVLGDEQRAMQYGVDETRNVAGFVERIGDAHWRLVIPRPHFESLTDVMELVPIQQDTR